MGPGKWEIFKKGHTSYKSGEKDSLVLGNGNDPDTNYHRVYSPPTNENELKTPKRN